MIREVGVGLVGDEFLAEEMASYAEAFRSETASLLHALISKMDIVEIQERFTAACRSIMGTEDTINVLHAAMCLRKGATLITYDRHFDTIRDEGIIEAWSIAEAIWRLP